MKASQRFTTLTRFTILASLLFGSGWFRAADASASKAQAEFNSGAEKSQALATAIPCATLVITDVLTYAAAATACPSTTPGTVTVTSTPAKTAPVSITPKATNTPRATATLTRTPVASFTATATRTPTATASVTARATSTARATATPRPSRTPSPTPTDAPLNFAVIGLEVTQAIQDLGNSVVLVRNKPAWARVHVRKTSGGQSAWITARLYRLVNGQRADFVLPNNGWIVPKSAPNRGAINDSFNFALPAAWTAQATLALEVEINPARQPAESSYSDNMYRNTVAFAATPGIALNAYLVRYRAGGAVHQAGANAAADLYDWLRRAYPVPGVRFNTFTLDMRWLGRQPTCSEVNLMLMRTRFWRQRNGLDPWNARYYGLVSDAGGFMRGCAPSIPSAVASGPTGPRNSWWDIDNGTFGDWYGGHELGHAFGRSHAMFCGATEGAGYPYPNGWIGGAWPSNRFYGWDIFLRSFVIYPPRWTDVMTYCPAEWISDFTYQGIRGQILRESGGFRAAESAATEPMAQVQGSIDHATNSAQIAPLQRFDGAALATAPIDGPAGFSMVVRDAQGAILVTQPFTPMQHSDGATVHADTHDDEPMLFDESVRFPAEAVLLQIEHDGVVIGEREVSANAPGIVIDAPAGDTTVGPAGLELRWQTSDADGDATSSTVLFSADGGATYAPLRVDITETQVLLMPDELAATQNGRLRLVVNDGANSTVADVDAVLTTANRAPSVAISAPGADTTSAIDRQILLAAQALDPDGALDDANIVWHSDISGVLGEGAVLTVQALPAGVHTISARVTDAAGAVVTATRTITVLTVLTPQPALLAAPQSHVFVAFAGSDTLMTETIAVRDAAETTLGWSASSDSAWLSLSEMGGVTPADPELWVDPSGLATGAYTGTLTIQSTGMAEQHVVVNLFVNAPAGRLWLPVVGVAGPSGGGRTLRGW